MNGLVNYALEGFLRSTYGAAQWQTIAQRAGLGFDRFGPLLDYPPHLTDRVIAAAAEILHRPRDTVLEDLGTWLVAPRSDGRLRRLLRFGGLRFLDFLHSLEELPGRARLALPDFQLPDMRLRDLGEGAFCLQVQDPFAGAHHLVMGILRAMADDYGALVLIDGGDGAITIQLLDATHAEARQFDLAVGAP